ncbi:hypothetical protein TNCV_810951 [Trichonephila clavipes]|uniref:Uncharacterized protein n=1 Tax=Trichonephila clavipes TaxID=2585209 RepID=A0A8X6V8B7_TRICX|nr:hypothetical protein TNCV_810951 [Trichonephila clavipes]
MKEAGSAASRKKLTKVLKTVSLKRCVVTLRASNTCSGVRLSKDTTLDKDSSVPKLVDCSYVGKIFARQSISPEEGWLRTTLGTDSPSIDEKNAPLFFVYPRVMHSVSRQTVYHV